MLTADPEVLERAADILEQNGWCRRSYEDSRGHHCVLGAIGVARYGNAYIAFDSPEHQFLKHALVADYGKSGVIAWNDAQRDGRKVVRFIRRAARKLRKSQAA